MAARSQRSPSKSGTTSHARWPPSSATTTRFQPSRRIATAAPSWWTSMIEHGIQLDHGREERLGFDEAIYAAGKSLAQLEAIVAHALMAGASRLFTRLDAAKYEALRDA